MIAGTNTIKPARPDPAVIRRSTACCNGPMEEVLDATIAEQIRRRGHDAEATQGNPGFEGNKDPDLLRAARDLDRVVVTDNDQDFARLHKRFLGSGEDYSGIILASPTRIRRSKRTIGLWAEALDTFLQDHAKTSLKNTCTWLS